MPYIKQHERKAARNGVPCTPGQVAYKAMQGAVDYMKALDPEGPWDWDRRSNAHKGLIAAEREFYRIYLEPYEDIKIIENGGIE